MTTLSLRLIVTAVLSALAVAANALAVDTNLVVVNTSALAPNAMNDVVAKIDDVFETTEF